MSPFPVDVSRNLPSAVCPFCDQERALCRASFSSMRLNRIRLATRCATEDYDRCGIFLAKVLRGSRSPHEPRRSLEIQK